MMGISQVDFFLHDEGLCVQCMHVGSYDDEPVTIRSMVDYARSRGYEIAIDRQAEDGHTLSRQVIPMNLGV